MIIYPYNKNLSNIIFLALETSLDIVFGPRFHVCCMYKYTYAYMYIQMLMVWAVCVTRNFENQTLPQSAPAHRCPAYHSSYARTPRLSPAALSAQVTSLPYFARSFCRCCCFSFRKAEFFKGASRVTWALQERARQQQMDAGCKAMQRASGRTERWRGALTLGTTKDEIIRQRLSKTLTL